MSDLNLESLSFDELYKLYDETTDDSLKLSIKKVVNNKPCEESTEFQSYPDIRNPNFQEIIYRKKEFHSNQLLLDTTQTSNPCGAEFSIKSHQLFLKNFMTKETPYRSLLVYHGVGVGKTCSGLTIAENFRDIYGTKDKRILILCSSTIQIGWKQTIYTPVKKENQCTGDTYTSSEATTQREVNKLIKQYYEIMAYQSFSNYVKRMITQYIAPYPEDQKDNAKKECIRKYFSDRLMIIDEVHNIRDDQGGEMRDTLKTIQMIIQYSDNMRLVLLTATPMYNRSTEIIWILNMMLMNDKRELLSRDVLFDKDGKLTEQGRLQLKDVSRGYVSYLRGENPITFPIRIYPNSLKKIGQQGRVYPVYTDKNLKQKCIVNATNSPSKNLVGGVVQTKLKFLHLLGSKLSGFQYKVYTRSIDLLLQNTPDLDITMRGNINPILDNIMLTQISNMVYPLDKPDMDDLQKHYGPLGLKQCMIRKGSKYTYSPKLLREYGPFFDKDILPNYSTKIATILDTIDNSEGIVFVYTNYVDSGIVPLKLALEQNGYVNHTGHDCLDYPDYSSRSEGQCKREGISYDGFRKSETDNFKQATYMVIDGSVNRKVLQEQLKIVTSPENSKGQKIKVILGTVVASEGLDFKRIRSIHILDPWPHLNRMEQTVGRGIRFCSHSDLDETEKNVTIYLHTTTLPKGWESIDTSIYRYAETKSIQIGEVETILKQSAVDRYLYRDVNVITKGRINRISHQPALRQSKEDLFDVTDKKYSKICSYQAECDYNSDLVIDDDFGLVNADTFVDVYSKPGLDTIKKRIATLYREFIVYNIDSMMGLLSEYGTNDPDIVYQALSEMIDESYTVYDKLGNSGHIVQKHSFYLFQPMLYDDKTIPLYYRKHILIHKQPIIYLDRLLDRDSEFQASKTYTKQHTEDVYQKLDGMITVFQQDIKTPDIVSLIEGLELVDPKFKLQEGSTQTVCDHPVVINYCFDRLDFDEKCSLLYSYFRKRTFPEYVSYTQVQDYLQQLILCKQGSSYYFKKEKSNLPEIGFFIVVSDKPQYYEFYQNEILPFNSVRLQAIQRDVKRYAKTSLHKTFVKNSPIWCYTIVRPKNKGYECVMKISQRKQEGKKYPPGPGNVCIENNLATHKDRIRELFDKLYGDIFQDYSEDSITNETFEICMSAFNHWLFPRKDTTVIKQLKTVPIENLVTNDITTESFVRHKKEVSKLSSVLQKKSYNEVESDKDMKDRSVFLKRVGQLLVDIQQDNYKRGVIAKINELNKTKSLVQVLKLSQYMKDNLSQELDSKQNYCCLLELMFRYENDTRITYFYPYDLIWMKYI